MRLFSTILLATVLLASSCKKECSPGTGGSNCSTKYRTAIVGQWHMYAACFSANDWDVTIVEGSGDNGVLIQNIDNSGANVVGSVVSERRCEIPAQTVNGHSYSGYINLGASTGNIGLSLTKDGQQCSSSGQPKN